MFETVLYQLPLHCFVAILKYYSQAEFVYRIKQIENHVCVISLIFEELMCSSWHSTKYFAENFTNASVFH